jgi:1-acyl-sn-glycerol-3-phosphate acyltransferase
LKAGVFQLAIAARIPIQPVAILGTWSMMPRGALGPRHAGTVRVRVGHPISVDDIPRGSAGRKALAARVAEALRDLGVE